MQNQPKIINFLEQELESDQEYSEIQEDIEQIKIRTKELAETIASIVVKQPHQENVNILNALIAAEDKFKADLTKKKKSTSVFETQEFEDIFNTSDRSFANDFSEANKKYKREQWLTNPTVFTADFLETFYFELSMLNLNSESLTSLLKQLFALKADSIFDKDRLAQEVLKCIALTKINKHDILLDLYSSKELYSLYKQYPSYKKILLQALRWKLQFSTSPEDKLDKFLQDTDLDFKNNKNIASRFILDLNLSEFEKLTPEEMAALKEVTSSKILNLVLKRFTQKYSTYILNTIIPQMRKSGLEIPENISIHENGTDKYANDLGYKYGLHNDVMHKYYKFPTFVLANFCAFDVMDIKANRNHPSYNVLPLIICAIGNDYKTAESLKERIQEIGKQYNDDIKVSVKNTIFWDDILERFLIDTHNAFNDLRKKENLPILDLHDVLLDNSDKYRAEIQRQEKEAEENAKRIQKRSASELNKSKEEISEPDQDLGDVTGKQRKL